ncbi:TRAP transporter large permease subunit [Rhodobacteraceae bacterium NNCM2]|nr:TRAP transporter large permease subunit [Coraliihabitans acroporae]
MEIVFLIVLIGLMAFALGSGYPVAFALPGSAIIAISLAAVSGYLSVGNPDAFFAHGSAVQWLSAGVTNFRGVYWEVERDTLIAIPLFIFMGIMLQRSQIAEDLLVAMAKLFGPIPGGLGISVVFVGALLAATTGILGATVVAMGLISLPAMLQRGYSQSLATGTIAASGTLGQIIPPSIVLIILADQLASAVDQASTTRKGLYKIATGELSMPSEFDVVSTSAGDMFLGALVPGILLVLLYMAYILVFALIKPSSAPAVHNEGKWDAKFFGKITLTLIPPLALIFLVLGSIIAGIATVNQAGAIGAVGATIMAGYRLCEGRRDAFIPAILGLISMGLIVYTLSNYNTNIKNIVTEQDAQGVTLALIGVGGLMISILWSLWRTYCIDDTLRGVMIDTAMTTTLVFIILLGAAMLTAAFRSFGGEELVKDFLNGLPGGFWSKFIIVMAVIFVLGFFLDFIEIAVVVVPIVAPILLADPTANVTAVWLGVMIGLNIQTSFLTPPFGFALFYLRGVADAAVRTVNMYKGVIPFIALQLLALVIVGLNPALVNYLPNRSSLLAETAPPPLNPRLQFSMENFVSNEFEENGAQIKSAIADIKAIDLSVLPNDLRKDLEKGIENAEAAFPAMADINAAAKAVADEAGNYRPLHMQVRQIEADIRRHEEEIARLTTSISRSVEGSPRVQKMEAKVAELQAEVDKLLPQIPAEWTDVHATFAKLTKAEQKARQVYRRTVDNAYEPVVELRSIIAGTEALKAVGEPLRQLQASLPGMTNEEGEEAIKEVEAQVREVDGTDAIKKELSAARRSLRGSRADPAKAAESMDKAVEAYDEDLAWRELAQGQLADALAAYDDAIKDTIGLRGQPKLPREQALFVASDSAGHRDISLNF